MEEETKEIKVQTSTEDLKGVYSNVMQVSHTQEEFVLDFLNVSGGSGVLVSRVILSPGHFKRMAKVLEDNLKKFEGRFGAIASTEGPQRHIGFKP